ncbi:MAG: ABC transporter substrate-binding protein [Candidatus Magnetomorum sp.]|nr:ABC transporter substrate-binding protein [Candidatus Magnetomorum sp.]
MPINAHSLWIGIDKASDLKGLSLATAWGPSLLELKKMGEQWDFARPREGTTAWVDNFMISALLEKRPRLKRIAEAWLDYVLSDEYQQFVVRGIGCEPVTTTVKDSLAKDEVNALHLNDPSSFNKKYILWPTLKKMDRKGLKRLWDKALSEREKSLNAQK